MCDSFNFFNNFGQAKSEQKYAQVPPKLQFLQPRAGLVIFFQDYDVKKKKLAGIALRG